MRHVILADLIAGRIHGAECTAGSVDLVIDGQVMEFDVEAFEGLTRRILDFAVRENAFVEIADILHNWFRDLAAPDDADGLAGDGLELGEAEPAQRGKLAHQACHLDDVAGGHIQEAICQELRGVGRGIATHEHPAPLGLICGGGVAEDHGPAAGRVRDDLGRDDAQSGDGDRIEVVGRGLECPQGLIGIGAEPREGVGHAERIERHLLDLADCDVGELCKSKRPRHHEQESKKSELLHILLHDCAVILTQTVT